MSKGRRIRASVAVAAAGALALSACTPPEEADGPGNEADDTQFLRLATGSTGGTYYPLGGEIAQLWGEHIEGVQVDTFPTGASVQNLRALEGETEDEEEGQIDQVELIMSVNGVAMQAKESVGPFEDQPLEDPDDVFFLGNIYPEVMQVVVLADSDIESIGDLDGANVEIGPAGSGTEVAARDILDVYGIDADEDINTFDSDFGDAATALGDEQVDAAFGILSVPAAGIEEISANNDVRLLPIEGEEAEELQEVDESYDLMDVEGGTYSGQDEDVTTLTQWASLYSTGSLDDETAYELTRVMYEHADELGHAVGDQVQLDTALDAQGPMELHPGAQQFYEDEGVL
ncbi:TAXI family TRAP transporter solute-binding subunit [Nocardiopsis sp. HNM0947]|uniref:TAXI family TRAP transporter solute-binding subunit n=1 Tax=Nocardiopsis coralli TaxID=2772213 RepID=A0ABR9PC68_9ACTN|nr:TAXI family TRAP transporter solute-binding subunit [Nocardiopsis coralli]MBE3001427.1 TAXI family TRAP transporter solute-binding subunit [Nocardiopsis coralli]